MRMYIEFLGTCQILIVIFLDRLFKKKLRIGLYSTHLKVLKISGKSRWLSSYVSLWLTEGFQEMLVFAEVSIKV